jgi:two-component system nitrate/nitrite response regulator NarL
MPPKGTDRDKVCQISQSAEQAFRVAIVDRDSMTSGLLADALSRDLGYVAVALRSSQLLQALAVRTVDLAAISADLDGRTALGLDLVKAVSSAHPKIPIVVLLDQPCPKSVINAFRSGARGLFCRKHPMSEFLRCVEHVRKGFIWAGGEETNFLLDALKRIPAHIELTEGTESVLTARESQVVRHAATGKTNKMIAAEMGLSEHTVKNYLFRAFDKLGVSSRVELLFYLTTCGHSFGPSEAKHPVPEVTSIQDAEAG